MVTYELGHLAGLDYDDRVAVQAVDVMGNSLGTGARRLPTTADVRHALGVDVNQPADKGKASAAAVPTASFPTGS